MTRTPLSTRVAAAAANVLGALVVALRAKWSTRALDAMIAFAAGFMISVCLIDIFPEAIARAGARGAMAALAGYLLVHLTQHTLAPHFHFGEETHEVTELVSVSALVGLLLHTFVDGVAIASGFHVSAALGTLVFVAIVLHKLPEGLRDLESLSRGGRGACKSGAGRGWRSALSTIAGVVVTDAAPALDAIGLGLSAGVTLYVAASNLVPEFQGKHDWRPQLAFVAGLRRCTSPRARWRDSERGHEAERARPAGRASAPTPSLFAPPRQPQPLAARMRPRTLDEFVGQQHLLAPGMALRESIERGKVSSMLFWGPPGTRQDDARAAHRELHRSRVRPVLRGHRRRAARARDHRGGGGAARDERARHHSLRRRDPPPQPRAAGCVSPARRARHHHAHRRDDRESVVRDQRRAAVAHARVRAARAHRRRRHDGAAAPRSTIASAGSATRSSRSTTMRSR